jgi:flagellar biosynthesis GTPase FlhF
VGDIAAINERKALAEQAFREANYAEAARHYAYLADSLGERDAGILLNLAHAQYLGGQAEQALEHYTRLAGHEEAGIRAAANNQLGAIYLKQQKPKEALPFFKAALKANPLSDEIRHNYELTKKLLEQQEEQQKQDQQQQQEEQQQDQQQQEEQEKKEQEEQEQKEQEQQQQQQGKEQEEGKEQEKQEGQAQEQQQEQRQQEQQERMKEINISEERAKMLLEAMKAQEMQYYQQMQRKGKARKESRNKPDW